MHAYLPAIGFGQIKKKSQLQQLLSSVQNFPDQVQKIRLDEESSLVVYTKEVVTLLLAAASVFNSLLVLVPSARIAPSAA